MSRESNAANRNLRRSLKSFTAPSFTKIVEGTVVFVDDKQQNGRLKVKCIDLGDTDDVETIPWARYCSPFGGIADTTTDTGTGYTAYGMWSVPKIGAQVAVFCLNGDVKQRVWFGCMMPFLSAGTLPHGSPDGSGKIMDSSNREIQPLSYNLQKSFGGTSSPEYQSRGVDHNASKIEENIRGVLDQKYKIKIKKSDLESSGYRKSRTVGATGLDSHVYSLTTPGFHSISMDDSEDNKRVRIRTSSGAQFLMDDTNERVYFSVPDGSAWIEVDYQGDVDVYTMKKISMHADEDINLTAGGKIKMRAEGGVDVLTPNNINIKGKTLNLSLTESVSCKAANKIEVESGAALHIKAGSNLHLGAGSIVHVNGGSKILETAPRIDLNGPPATAPNSASPDAATHPSRNPLHEPWPRQDQSDSGGVIGSPGRPAGRNKNWRR